MAGLVSQSTIEQIRAASDIVDIIGNYFPLKRAGGNFVALCPFHTEKTPSFNVNAQRQIYHCFGCHAGGDVFKFIQEHEHVDFMEAVRRLAERAGIVLEFENNPEADRKRRQKDLLLKAHEQLAQHWHALLLNDAAGEPAREYLTARGISEAAVKEFRLGFAPLAWEDTVNWAKSKKIDLALMEAAGLVASKDGRHYGRFRARLMFPIHDEQGRVIGFSGRVLEAEAKAAKYVNSPETILFHKSKVFYGLDKARREILSGDCALICEGQLDTIACHMAGIRHTVAPQGTALTADHARLLKRYDCEVVLCFDSDVAGQNAAVRSFDALLEAELPVRVMTVPAPHDPDSFIREKGAEAFRELMDNAPGYFEFYLTHLLAENDAQSDQGRQAIIRAMGTAVLKAKDAVLLDRCAQQVALALGASAEAVRAEFARITLPRTYQPRAAEPEQPAPEPVTPPSPQEQWLLRLAFYDSDCREWAADFLETKWVEHSQVRAILERGLESGAAVEVLVRELDDSSERLFTAVLAAADAVPEPLRQLRDLATRLRDRYFDQRLAELTRLTAQPNLPEPNLLRVLEEQEDLRKRKLKQLPAAPLAEV
jgi:DNA primase